MEGAESEQAAPEESIRQALEAVLEPGQAWVVSRDGEGVLVQPAAQDAGQRARCSSLQRTHTRLYGGLLAANQRISDAFGCGLMTCAALTVAAPCLTLHLRLLHGLFADDARTQRLLEGLRAWWAYGVLALIGFTVWIRLSEWLEEQAYRREREALLEQAASGGLSGPELIGLAEGDAGLSTLAKYLKRDAGIG